MKQATWIVHQGYRMTSYGQVGHKYLKKFAEPTPRRTHEADNDPLRNASAHPIQHDLLTYCIPYVLQFSTDARGEAMSQYFGCGIKESVPKHVGIDTSTSR